MSAEFAHSTVSDKMLSDFLVSLFRLLLELFQGGHWSGKSQGNFIFLRGQGKVRDFCKNGQEILESQGKATEFHDFGLKPFGCGCILAILSD